MLARRRIRRNSAVRAATAGGILPNSATRAILRIAIVSTGGKQHRCGKSGHGWLEPAGGTLQLYHHSRQATFYAFAAKAAAPRDRQIADPAYLRGSAAGHAAAR